MRVAIYARVSKATKGIQNPNNQLIPLRKLAESLGAEIAGEYIDYVSGGSSDRPQFKKMLKDSFYGNFHVVLVWSLDRFIVLPPALFTSFFTPVFVKASSQE